jgi:copper transport protein
MIQFTKFLSTTVVFVLCAMFAVTPAQAHARLETSIPAADEILDAFPKELSLTFSEPIKLINVVVVEDRGQEAKGFGPARIEGKILYIPVSSAQINGVYTVNYQVVGTTDSHPVGGSLKFSIHMNH